MTEDEWADLAQELIRSVEADGPSLTDWLSAVASVLTLGIAVAAAFVAKGQLAEASKARKQTKQLELEKSQPYVVLTMEESVSPQIIDLVMRNYGQTVAYDVKLELDPWPKRSHDGEDVKVPEVIPVMAPGQEWRTYWDEGSDRLDSELPDKHVGKVTYFGVNKEALSSNVILDWSIYKARIWTVMYGIHDLAKAVREMRDTHKKWVEGPKGGLNVYVRDGDAKDGAEVQRAKAYREARAAQRSAHQQAASALKSDSNPEVN